ncbi:uncharacterized protein MYCGRDRAFT_94667 [Zymoseptoria tritici IPO323]|uniref:RING-type domain-containing protein n=3 Tax=Zymoseptoria tritici TaxID=1047171 RepID=F9XGP5_ZYMTI|nr:uncharacterized protein MYCGRDRAFT_94667 [Zymoseptoria tritici IPO323]EGP86000.1 hypothetical protein MYCGRDRAFT_94667 [Zymoseptoria tritici IPO323]
MDGALFPSISVDGDQRVSTIDRSSAAKSRLPRVTPGSSRILRAQHRRRLLLGNLPPLIMPARIIPTEERVFHRQETIWQPIVVRLPNSLQELRSGLLNPAQLESFHHWQEHEFAVWFQTTPDANEHVDDFYDPFADTDPVATWYTMAHIHEMGNQVETVENFEAPSWTYANPLYTEEQSEEEIIASLPLVTITASLPTASLGNDDTANEAALQKHKMMLECMGGCRICGEAISGIGYAAQCGHVCCVGEMIEWLKFQSSCPSCREVLKHEDSCLVQMADAEEAAEEDLNCGGADKNGDGEEPGKGEGDAGSGE